MKLIINSEGKITYVLTKQEIRAEAIKRAERRSEIVRIAKEEMVKGNCYF
jgi:hypothetical protein